MPDEEQRVRVALELNALNWTGAFDDSLEGARIGVGTPIYDLHGTQLWERIPLTSDRHVGYADVAVHPAIGAVLMAVSQGLEWNEEALLEEADRAVGKHLPPGAKAPDERRFVAYSYPKLAVQFRAGDEELALLELWSWLPVPPQREDAENGMPSSFSRWSYLDHQSPDLLDLKRRAYDARVRELETVPGRLKLPLDRIDRDVFAANVDVLPRSPFAAPAGDGAGGDAGPGIGGVDGGVGGGAAGAGIGAGGGGAAGGGGGGAAGAAAAALPSQRELQFSASGTNHALCYELQGQATSLWCVAASVQMLLAFYRFEYAQDRLATALGLGTQAQPKDLAVGQEGKVVNAIRTLTSNGFDVTMKKDPDWTDFRDEIIANRPVISFVPGHARTIAGYTDTGPVTASLGPFLGLLVYDPWPPNAGVVTRWENSAVRIYKFAFMARPRLV